MFGNVGFTSSCRCVPCRFLAGGNFGNKRQDRMRMTAWLSELAILIQYYSLDLMNSRDFPPVEQI